MRHWDITETLSTVIYDDKQNFDVKFGSDNIKKSRLTRDNRQAIICHIAATTSINFVLGTECKRSNDSTYSSTLRLIKNIFSPSRVSAMLNHAKVHMDRRHWAHTVLCFFLDSGSVMCGKVKIIP